MPNNSAFNLCKSVEDLPECRRSARVSKNCQSVKELPEWQRSARVSKFLISKEPSIFAKISKYWAYAATTSATIFIISLSLYRAALPKHKWAPTSKHQPKLQKISPVHKQYLPDYQRPLLYARTTMVLWYFDAQERMSVHYNRYTDIINV